MKVTCQYCNKKFDYEDKMGICPSCGHYIKSPHLAEAREVKVRTKKNRKIKISTIISILLILMMVGYFAVMRFMIYPQEREALYQKQKNAVPECAEINPNEKFLIKDVQFEIKDPLLFELEGIKPDEGYMYIEVPYSVYTSELPYSLTNSMTTYLNIDGNYIMPLSIFDFRESQDKDSVGMVNLRSAEISDVFEGTVSGRFVFLVPEGSHEYELNIYRKEQDIDNEYKPVSILESIYKISLKEVR